MEAMSPVVIGHITIILSNSDEESSLYKFVVLTNFSLFQLTILFVSNLSEPKRSKNITSTFSTFIRSSSSGP